MKLNYFLFIVILAISFSDVMGTYMEARCLLTMDQGHCVDLIQMYAYNRNTDKCERFLYGGCGGNENRFRTRKECKRACGDSPPHLLGPRQSVAKSQQEGNRYMSGLRFRLRSGRNTFRNPQSEREFKRNQDFVYLLSKNMKLINLLLIVSLAIFCEARIIYIESRCLLPKQAGPCLAIYHRYFFNARSGRCEFFVFGGCYGNDNQFGKLSACQDACERDHYYD
ncbi:carboxypeptidase inhibitor SmCI-like [Helicoverpa armigera]|uniref:carboxypeptidase inhibitor SmCI-like n=1 Tax=Helicoverpa armigera TaxID=29058 RepID=UPI00308296A8